LFNTRVRPAFYWQVYAHW